MNVSVKPFIIGDSAYELKPWMLKPHTNAVLSDKQRNFNYRLSRARMVIEGAFGQLKGRFRVLMRKSECSKETVKIMALACVALHNMRHELDDRAKKAMNVQFDEVTLAERPRELVRELLLMRSCKPIHNKDPSGEAIRKVLTDKVWAENESGMVF